MQIYKTKKMTNADINSTTFLVKPEVLAKFLKVNTSRVHQLGREGTIPKPVNGPGTWDLMACIHAYWEYKEELSAKDPKDANYLKEKTRLTKAQADKEELAVHEKKGQLIDSEKIFLEYSNYILACRAKLLSIPTKIAYELIGENNPNIIQNKLQQAIDEALLELSSTQFIDDAINESDPQNSD
jgi:phage terminase Nu1 subunit (DNA packaging protein)